MGFNSSFKGLNRWRNIIVPLLDTANSQMPLPWQALLHRFYHPFSPHFLFQKRTVRFPIYSQLNWAILLCDVIPDGKNWVNCAILTGNKAGLGTVFSSRLSHREMRTSLRETHSFLSLPADTTMASPQGTSISSNSFSRWASHDIFLFRYFLLHILRFLFFFLDNIMADMANKQQTTALFLSTIVTRTRRHTQLTKNWQTW